MFERPYRNVPTETLQRLYDTAVMEVDRLVKDHYQILSGPVRKLVRSYGRELTKRKRENND